jgi:sulfate permease, SulP family
MTEKPDLIIPTGIGGVGWFLVATGFEVSARMDGSLEYDLDTLNRLLQPSTIPLWIIPLILAVVLFYGQQSINSKYFLPLYVCSVPLVFYFFVLCFGLLDADNLREAGWIFNGPSPGEPWWHFWTLYRTLPFHPPPFFHAC